MISSRKKTPSPLFRPLIAQAGENGWRTRSLWPIAAIAGIAGIGNVIDSVLHQTNIAQNVVKFIPINSIQGIFTNRGEFLRTWLSQSIDIQPQAIVNTYLGLLVFGLALLVAVCVAQYIIIQGLRRLNEGRPMPTLSTLRKGLNLRRIYRLAAMNALTKILLVDLFLLSEQTLVYLGKFTPWVATLGTLLVILAALFVSCLISILGVYTLIEIVEENQTLAESYTKAWRLFTKHAAVSLEMSALQFSASYIFSGIYTITLLALATLLAPVFGLFFLNNSPLAITVLFFAYVLCMAIFTVCFAGFSTTFTLSLWSGLHENLSHHRLSHPSRVLHHFKKRA
jgi:hypothetical protein